ncbi:MAG: D-alanyl-D-alanine carboxypeptidase [Xanthomonadales bacterium]|nr:D-alanyl-D-alanine carboxypeptidase [Xanthomonadales bacterium]
MMTNKLLNTLVYKQGYVLLLLVFLLAALAVPVSLAAQEKSSTATVKPARAPMPAAPQLNAKSYFLQDFQSGTILAEKNADLRVDPASITKLMTSYVVFNELKQGKLALTDISTISEKAWRTEGSRMFIEVGKQVSIEDLIKGMVIQSGNDASVALAEHIAGTEDAFASMMNHYALELGMTNSHFVNATGLPHPEHYVTARDIATMSTALISQFPVYYAWYSEKEFTFNKIRQHNRNTLLWRDPSVDGLKTGHTEAAGYCLTASAIRKGMRLLAVIMGTDSQKARTADAQAMLNYGFRFFETHQLYQADQQITEAVVWRGESEEIQLSIAEDFFVTIQRGRYDSLDARVTIDPELSAPISKGQPLGKLQVFLDGEEIGSRPLLAMNDIAEAGFFGRSYDSIRLWVGGLFGGSDE